MKGGVGRIAGGGVMYATDTDHVGIPFVALLAPSEHRVRNTRLQSIMQTAVSGVHGGENSARIPEKSEPTAEAGIDAMMALEC